MIAPPVALRADELAVWDEAVAFLTTDGREWVPAWAPMVERYARAVALARRAWRRAGTGLLTKGSQGQTVAHPLVAIAQKADAEAARFGAMIGLDLTVKRSAGRPPGAASAADRAGAPARVKLRSVG